MWRFLTTNLNFWINIELSMLSILFWVSFGSLCLLWICLCHLSCWIYYHKVVHNVSLLFFSLFKTYNITYYSWFWLFIHSFSWSIFWEVYQLYRSSQRSSFWFHGFFSIDLFPIIFLIFIYFFLLYVLFGLIFLVHYAVVIETFNVFKYICLMTLIFPQYCFSGIPKCVFIFFFFS